MEQPTPTAVQDALPTRELLLALGQALLRGVPWAEVFTDGRWAWRALQITYTHDRLGTPDHVDGVFFERAEAESLAQQMARSHAAGHAWQRQFLTCKVTEWPLGTLAVRDAHDSFHRGVLRHVVMLIKQALRDVRRLPRGVTPITIGAAPVASAAERRATAAYIDCSGSRAVLWEDCNDIAGEEASIGFITHGRPPLCGLMNGNGEILLPPAWERLSPLRHGLAVAARDGRFGYIDARGNVVVPLRYEDAQDCCQDLLLVKWEGLWGALDREGREVIAPRYQALSHDAGNHALRAMLDGRHGCLSLDGALLAGYCDHPLALAEPALAGDSPVFAAHDFGTQAGERNHILVDALGQPSAVPAAAGIAYGPLDEGIRCATMTINGNLRHGYVGLHGETLIAFRFCAGGNFSEGLAAVAEESSSSLFGYIDRRGEWAIAPAFDDAGPFRNGLAAVSAPSLHAGRRQRLHAWLHRLRGQAAQPVPPRAAGRRYGYIDRNGRWAIAPLYLEARPFCSGLAAVRTAHGWRYIDSCGEPVTASLYQEAGPFRHGVARIGRNCNGVLRYGLVDSCGREVIPPRFERLTYPQRGLIAARDEFGLWGCFTLYGNIVAPFIYRDAHDLQTALAARGAIQLT